MKKEDMDNLHKGTTINGTMKKNINIPMQGVSFSAGESVAIIPSHPGADIVIIASKKDSRKRAEMSLYQVEQFVA